MIQKIDTHKSLGKTWDTDHVKLDHMDEWVEAHPSLFTGYLDIKDGILNGMIIPRVVVLDNNSWNDELKTYMDVQITEILTYVVVTSMYKNGKIVKSLIECPLQFDDSMNLYDVWYPNSKIRWTPIYTGTKPHQPSTSAIVWDNDKSQMMYFDVNDRRFYDLYEHPEMLGDDPSFDDIVNFIKETSTIDEKWPLREPDMREDTPETWADGYKPPMYDAWCGGFSRRDLADIFKDFDDLDISALEWPESEKLDLNVSIEDYINEHGFDAKVVDFIPRE